MAKAVKPLEELVRELPPDLRSEVQDLIEFLLAKHRPEKGRVLRQSWAGALADYREQYTSVQLQHLASDWRTTDD